MVAVVLFLALVGMTAYAIHLRRQLNRLRLAAKCAVEDGDVTALRRLNMSTEGGEEFLRELRRELGDIVGETVRDTFRGAGRRLSQQLFMRSAETLPSFLSGGETPSQASGLAALRRHGLPQSTPHNSADARRGDAPRLLRVPGTDNIRTLSSGSYNN